MLFVRFASRELCRYETCLLGQKDGLAIWSYDQGCDTLLLFAVESESKGSGFEKIRETKTGVHAHSPDARSA